MPGGAPGAGDLQVNAMNTNDNQNPTHTDNDSISEHVIQDLRGLSSDDPDGFLVELIDLFQTDAEEYLARIDAAATATDASVVRKNAHGLKGSSGNLGAKTMSSLCHQIEIAASEVAPNWNVIHPILASLVAEAARVKLALAQRRQQAIQPK